MPGPGSKTIACLAKTTLSQVGLATIWKYNYDLSLGDILPLISREQLTWLDLCWRGKQPAGRHSPFLGSGFFAEALSAAASLSSHRLICSCLILKKRICFCSSLSSASRSGSMYMSDNICFSMAAGFQLHTFVAMISRDRILFLAPTRKSPSLPEPGAGMQACQSNYTSVFFFF